MDSIKGILNTIDSIKKSQGDTQDELLDKFISLLRLYESLEHETRKYVTESDTVYNESLADAWNRYSMAATLAVDDTAKQNFEAIAEHYRALLIESVGEVGAWRLSSERMLTFADLYKIEASEL